MAQVPNYKQLPAFRTLAFAHAETARAIPPFKRERLAHLSA